ncbi:MAG TPA: cyclodeaminase/cyclohydrolase family protein, partial [Chloroflexota bacterium]|nr:cyclodeaminase/cyclohydrolase family protein [Chloroflexota bacterium]
GEQTCCIGNPNLVGDAAGGGSLARGALRICQLNIAANVGMIVDDAFVQDTESRLAAAAKSLCQADITVDRHL